jgi:hypothetical protein
MVGTVLAVLVCGVGGCVVLRSQGVKETKGEVDRR